MSQLSKLATPFPDGFIETKPGKFAAAYVPHGIVTQFLLGIVGPYDFSIDDVVRDADGTLTGCLCTLVVEIDGRVTSIQEVGECENPNNWKTDGARLKACASDGIKRCAMRLGLGLHLWHKQDGNYVLADILNKREEDNE
ncbi:MAG: hypothetical protein CMF29_00105 [Kiritimatiellaceae bacterium]|nr:hypothetical protein [Kiritimatiellaceae bacterium]|tara:strand:- start:207 stop:626 length:420 start_codon:yes stop_codon:yes gene_type:complete